MVKNSSNAGISVVTRDVGNRTINAPMTPEIAPLAPTVGIFEPQLNAVWTAAEPIPHMK